MQGQPVRRVDHALSVGRLALLPFEIRQHIFYLVLQEFFPEDTSMARWIIMPFSDAWNKSMLPSVDDLDVDLAVTAGTAEGFLPSIFELRAYYVDFRSGDGKSYIRHDSKVGSNVRLVSRIIRAEWEDMLLTTHTFSFDCAKQLRFFVCQLAPHQRNRFFHVSFRLFLCQNCCWRGRLPSNEWMEELKGLPKEVQTVSYALEPLVAGCTMDQKAAFVGSRSKLEAACAGLDVLNQRVMRGLKPEVRTKMTGTIYWKELNDVERATFDRVLEGADYWR